MWVLLSPDLPNCLCKHSSALFIPQLPFLFYAILSHLCSEVSH